MSFEPLIGSVEEVLAYSAQHPREVKPLMGVYAQSMATLPQVA